MRYIVDLCGANVIMAKDSAFIPTRKDGDFPMFRLLVETLADPRSAIFALQNPTIKSIAMVFMFNNLFSVKYQKYSQKIIKSQQHLLLPAKGMGPETAR